VEIENTRETITIRIKIRVSFGGSGSAELNYDFISRY